MNFVQCIKLVVLIGFCYGADVIFLFYFIFLEIKMPTTRWNRRRLIIFSVCLLIVYWIFSASRNTYTSEVTIRNTKPEVAWEYVADFQKMRSLNPTM